MRIISLLVLFWLSSTATKAQSSENIDYLKEGDYIPEFSIPLGNGDTLSSVALKGKTIVVVFFATWCPPCLKELPHVQKEIWEKYRDRENFRLLVIGREHTLEDIIQFKQKNNYTFPCIADADRSIFSVFAKQNIPRMYLIDKEGKIIKMSSGFTPNLFHKFQLLLEQQLNTNS